MALHVDKKELFTWAAGEKKTFEATLKQFVDVPTVSAQPENKKDMERGVELAVETIRRFGGTAEVFPTSGYPIVQGTFESGKGLPTVTVYNHMDVQPASRETEPWDSEPFEMQVEDDRYLGRGTTDDKGPALSALFGVRAAREAGVKANLRVLWEFEEEIGSPNFAEGIRQAGSKLATDSVIVSDTIWVSRSRPACPAGLRGLQGFSLTLETGTTDTHSGTTGGAARNPIGELMQLIGDMYDAKTGKVKIPGFYDDVKAPSRRELEDFASSGFTINGFKKDHKLKSIRTSDPIDAMKRIWAMPTLEIHGVVGGYTGPGIKTIIPPRAEVKLSCRLVANQNPFKILKLIRSFVKSRNKDIVVVPEGSMFPYRAPVEGVLADAVKRSMKFAFGKEPVFVREGGSIGAVVSMEKILDCPVMFLGLSLPEHGYHAPNENFDWQQASGGMVAFAHYFDQIAAGND